MDNCVKEVTVRWEDQEVGGYCNVRGVLLAKDLVLVLCYGDLEIHYVSSTEIPDVYDLVYSFGPLFHVGDEITWEQLFLGLQSTSVLDFARKFPPLEYYEFTNERSSV
ncbi:hypothetical protein [Tumebacillus flagellatus]|uniref:hypothetical protein n=1 Tax=Tumebacillus flagellatus TaxID=1157490 RepID=UPI001267D431|nr:hypothetical protein [Tumebacillus flagellatus]